MDTIEVGDEVRYKQYENDYRYCTVTSIAKNKVWGSWHKLGVPPYASPGFMPVDEVELVNKGVVMKYKVGDKLVNSSWELVIQGIIGSVYVCIEAWTGGSQSFESDPEAVVYTEKQLEDDNYKLKTEPKAKKMTVAQIAKELGHDVEVVK